MNPISFRPVQPGDALTLQRLYASSPRYFQSIAAPLPLLEDVTRELESALADPRRSVEFIFFDGACSGYLDLKFDYPQAGDVTVNLLLIAEIRQRQGIGARVMRALEERLRGRVTRILAGVFGENPGAARFWEGLGYHFAVDARPVLSWYAKTLAPRQAPQETEPLEAARLEAAR